MIEFARGRFLRRSGRRRAAAEVLAGASDTLAALGAQPLLARCTRELEACGLTPVKRGGGSGSLAPHSTGAVDRATRRPKVSAIARELSREFLVSVKTVERHLTHVYRKLGVDSRAELIAP